MVLFSPGLTNIIIQTTMYAHVFEKKQRCRTEEGQQIDV